MCHIKSNPHFISISSHGVLVFDDISMDIYLFKIKKIIYTSNIAYTIEDCYLIRH